jgi:sporulation integral membrane protein YtvI
MFLHHGGLFMRKIPPNWLFTLIAGGFGLWFFLRYGLPILLPFALGAGLALAAEPPVGFLQRKLGLPRYAATGFGVSLVFLLLIAAVTLLVALLVREAGQLSTVLPELADFAQGGLEALRTRLLQWTDHAPEGLRPLLQNTVSGLFSGSGSTADRLSDRLLETATALVKSIAGSALSVATAVLAAFMISARLPRLRSAIRPHLPPLWKEKYQPALKELRSALLGWLTAQLKLSAITFLQLLAGFWLLRIPRAILWAMAVALVDAFPVLGTGTVLLPWSILCFLQGQAPRGIGLLGLYAVIWLVRSILEPRLLGKELGLDPLVTLGSMYAGYRLLGIPGMILCPILAVATARAIKTARKA